MYTMYERTRCTNVHDVCTMYIYTTNSIVWDCPEMEDGPPSYGIEAHSKDQTHVGWLSAWSILGWQPVDAGGILMELLCVPYVQIRSVDSSKVMKS